MRAAGTAWKESRRGHGGSVRLRPVHMVSGPVTIVAGGRPAFNFGLRPAGIISGTARLNGTPAAKVTVLLTSTNVFVQSAETSADGTFRFEDLPDAIYRIGAVVPGAFSTPTREVQLNAAKNAVQVGIELQAAAIAGRVLTPPAHRWRTR